MLTLARCATLTGSLGALALTPAAADAAPAVSFVSPAADAAPLAPDQATPIKVDASATSVAIYADDRQLCVDSSSPFQCDFEPTLEEIGRTTLVATATDSRGEKATTVRTVVIRRAVPARLSLAPVVRRAKPGWSAITSGRLVMATEHGTAFCAAGGAVTIKYQYGRKARLQTLPLRPDCTYASVPMPIARVAVSARRRLLTRVRFLGSGAIEATPFFSHVSGLR